MHLRRRARQRTAAAGIGLALLAVTGCGVDEPDVETAPTATTSPTPTPSPTPTLDLTRLPERPAAMAEPTKEGAIAAATYVLDLYGYTFATGDLEPWRGITLDSCTFCVKVTDMVDEIYRSGDQSSGSTFAVDSTRGVEIADDQWFSVDLRVTQSPSLRTDARGEVVGDDPGGEYRAVFALSWNDGWRVDSMGFTEPDAENPAIDE